MIRATFPQQRNAAFSMMEVMISVAILATVLTILAANVFTLSVARNNAKEEAIVQEVLTGLMERIQSESLASLGLKNENLSHLNAWSWHRRVHPRWPKTATDSIVPMTETVPTVKPPAKATFENVRPFSNCLLSIYDGEGQLISPGLLQQQSGVKNLAVYVEYYKQEVFLEEMIGAPQPHKMWTEICESTGKYKGTNNFIYSDEIEDEDRIDLTTDKNAAVLIRVVVTWTASDGGNRSRELTLARRQ